jgi:integrase
MAQRITDKLVREVEPPESGNRRIYDTDIKGFGVRVTAAGVKAFVLNYYAHGRERRHTIGRYPGWSVLAARKKAADLKRTIDNGGDPVRQRQESRAAPTMVELFERYAAEHLPRKAPRAAADDRSMWNKIILPFFGHRKVAEVTHADCDHLHQEIGADRPVRANRVIEVLRKAMNLAIRWGWRSDNPANGVRRNPEEPRERHLTRDEVGRLMAALSAHRERTSATAIHLMILTGCRRGEALSATWAEFDLATGVWVKPSAHTKQRKLHRVPLSDPAVALLLTWQAAASGGLVFPGQSGRPLTDVKRTWEAVRRQAGLEGVRLHDLRHTYASILASHGQSLPTIGAMLGHTQAQTTARYSHLLDDPQRAAAKLVGTYVEGSTQ